MNNIIKISVILLLAFIGFFAAKHFSNQSDLPRYKWSQNCDLGQSACKVELPNGGQLIFSLTPRGIPLMELLKLEVQLSDTEYAPQFVDIIGLNMEMGINRTALSKLNESSWRGETILPICSQRRMHWEAQIRLQGVNDGLMVPFEFYTNRN